MLKRLLTPGRTLVPIAAAAALLAVAGCGGADGTGGGAAGGDRTITFATPGGANVSNTPFLVAQGIGAFDRHGLTVEPQEFATGVDALAALTGGSVDVAMIAGLDLLRAAEKDAGVLGFYTPFLSSASAIVASTRLQADHGTDLGRFADASWGYAKEGTSSTFYMQTLATGAGLDWDGLNRAALGSQTAMLAALQAGRVDIVSMDSTSSAKAVQQGLGYVVVNTSDPAVTEKYWPRQLGTLYVTTKQFAQENPQLLQDFVAGLVDGQARTLESAGDAPALLALMRPEQQGVFADSWAEQWAIMGPAYEGADGTVPEDVVRNTLTWATSSGALPPETTVPAFSTFVDNSYVEKAYADRQQAG